MSNQGHDHTQDSIAGLVNKLAALTDKVQQLERRMSYFVDDSCDIGDVTTDTALKETERTT